MFKRFRGSSLRKKLAVRFGILVSIFTLAMFLTFLILKQSIDINNRITNTYNPAIKKLENIKLNVINSRSLITSWIANQADNHPDKIKLREIIQKNFPAAKKELETEMVKWEKNEQEKSVNILKRIDSLTLEYNKVTTGLATFDSYQDPTVILLTINPLIDEGGSITILYNKVINSLDEIIALQNKNMDQASREMTDSLNTFKNFIIFIVLITVVIGIIITITTVRIITLPINKVKNALVDMGKGKLPKDLLSETKDEIGEMSSALNYLSDGLKKTAAYADRIGNGDMEATFEPLSNEDLLGNSLLEMGKKLKKLNEEDNKRNWAAQGLANFAQLLRESSDMQVLCDNIISKLVKYVDANQGSIFLINQDDEHDEHLTLTACYAYDRKKFLNKIIHPGEGLVGQCYLEKDTIYLTDVPDQYVNITSGLGEATPRCIAIFPLIINDAMHGVIEIASFKVLDKYAIEFIQKLCENIAGTISNTKINQRTVRLLEDSKMSQQSMMEKEEEMRQNLEELTATQEDMARKEIEYQHKIEELESQLQNK